MRIIIPVRMTKKGPEMLTRDLPWTSEKRIKHLDDRGVPILGTIIQAGMILVGKVCSTRPLSSEEIKLADIGLWTAGPEDLWKNVPYIAKKEDEGMVKYVDIQIKISSYLEHSLPLRYIKDCERIPTDTILEEVYIEIT